MTDRTRSPRSADRDERAIVRVARDKAHPYSIVNNTPLRDPRLSWPAKGIIGYLLTMPDDWQVMMGHLTPLHRILDYVLCHNHLKITFLNILFHL